MICLLPAAVDKFRAALIDGTIDPGKLAQMTSEERHALFKDIVGTEAATHTNALFESKMLLKNQQQGYITWAKKISGVTPEVRRDLISRIQKMDKVLNPAEEQQFLNDLAQTKLGVGVSREEAKTIADMSKKVETTRINMAQGGDREDWGHAKIALRNYMAELKHQAGKSSLSDYALHPTKVAGEAAGISKSLKASMDDSAIGRPGLKTLFTHPTIWAKNARLSLVDMVKTFGGKEVLDHVDAEIVSRPTYDKLVKMKAGLDVMEEQYPSHLLEKVPLLGRVYKASEVAYTAFQRRTRADLGDAFLKIAEKHGINTGDRAQLESIGKLVGSLTNRGHLGKLEPAADAVNSVLFSPRAMKANFDTLTAHQFQKGVTPFVRKQAAKETLKIAAGISAVLAIADAVKPGSVEVDPRSADFGKIKSGNTRFDVTGGMASMLTLGARMFTQSSKNSSTGAVTKLNTGGTSLKGMDVFWKFFENKASPAASVVMETLINHKDRNGNRPTLKGEALNAFEPLPSTNFRELKDDPHSANKLVAILADAFGIATNTYGKSTKNFDNSTTKQMQEFKAKVSPADFKKANDEYNQKMDEWNQANLPSLKDQTDAVKQQMITNAKSDLQTQVLKKYGYVYQMTPEEKKARSDKAKATHLKKLQSSSLYQ